MLGGVGAVVHRVQHVPGREICPAPRADAVGLGSEILAVVGQAVEPDRSVGQVGGDLGASGFEFGAHSLVLGGFGTVLPDPLGHVLDGVAAAQCLHGGGARVSCGGV